MENKCKYKENEICNHTLCLCRSCYIYKSIFNEPENNRDKERVKYFERLLKE